MSQVSAIPCSLPNKETGHEVKRRSAGYHPSIWGDYFLKYAYASNSVDDGHDQHAEQEFQKLKDEVKRLLCTDDVNEISLKLDMIDQIQRLGIAYHFASEIDHVLKQLNETCFVCNDGDRDINDLYTAALLFRLLRQQGYRISCDIFNKFKDTSGKFSETHATDVRGLLSLYEASHLSVHGEDVLDQAFSFSLTHLQSIKEQRSPPLAPQVFHALEHTIRRGVPRLETRRYISMYEAEPSHNEVLLSLAKLDFNRLQKLHQKELFDLARWWMGLDFKTKFPFARDRLMEGYFWILGLHIEPESALARRFMTKVFVFISVLDDIYDVYGTYEELELFTEAIQRWDVDCINELPEYMQVYYKALIDVYVEMEETLACKGKSYCLGYAIEAMKSQARGYFAEAKWLHQQHKPTMDEYMPLALVTSGYPLLAVTSFVGMADIVTKDDLEWLSNNPKILKASSIIARLMDDLASRKFEKSREHGDSAVQCYMKQYGVTEQEAIIDLRKQVEDAWKDINEECLCLTAVAMPLLMAILNLTRVLHVIYKDGGDHYTNPHIILKDYIKSVLVDPVK